MLERIKKMKEEYERRKAIREAKELERLRKKRIELEGKAKRKRLKERELLRIERARKTLSHGKKNDFLDFGFGFESKKGKSDSWNFTPFGIGETHRKAKHKRKNKRRSKGQMTIFGIGMALVALILFSVVFMPIYKNLVANYTSGWDTGELFLFRSLGFIVLLSIVLGVIYYASPIRERY